MALDLGTVAVSLVLASVVFALIWSLRLAKNSTASSKKVKETTKKNGTKEVKKDKSAPKKKPASNPPVKETKSQFTHSWLLTTLKGHTSSVLDMDFSPNGKHLATCCEDRSLMLWTLRLDKLDSNVKELNMKDIRTVRCSVKFDHATRIRWSPDSKALLTVRAMNNDVEIYRLNKKPEAGALPSLTPTVTFPKHREADLIGIEVASTGRFIMTCTPKNEVDLIDLKGQIIHSLTTNQMVTYCAKISPCAKLLVVSGFTPDVKVMEVVYSKAGEFERVARAFELSGHTSGIWSFDFSPDSSRMVTVSKDGTWRLYNTNIDYRKGQLATLLTSGKWLNTNEAAHVALSPDGLVIAIGSGSRLTIHSAATGETLAQIDGIHTEPIRAVRIDSSSRFILTTGDRVVRVFHNVPGYQMAVSDLESKLRKAGNQTLRERIQQQLNEAQTLVNRFN